MVRLDVSDCIMRGGEYTAYTFSQVSPMVVELLITLLVTHYLVGIIAA